jgi:hypothetical protein
MIERSERRRKTWLIAAALLLVVAVAFVWGKSRGDSGAADDPRELLRRASSPDGTDRAKPTGKTVEVAGTNFSGEPVRARLVEIEDGFAKKGHAIHLAEPLEEGESTVLEMPGGGSVTVSRPREGETPQPPPATKKSITGQEP